MDLVANLAIGFEQALTWNNLLYCLIGCALGTLIGVLPGLGPVATIAMLLPISFGLPVDSAMIMLAGIYYGAQYGGSTTAILINLPGEPGSVVTAIEGYHLAKAGKAGLALFTAAVGSFFAGTVATFLIAGFAPALAGFALKFQPADYFSLMVLGLVAAVALAHGSLVKALGMVTFGLLLSTMGQDLYTGTPRFSFGFPQLSDGVDFSALAMGLFGISEVIRNLEVRTERRPITSRIRDLIPTKEEIKQIVAPILRGTIIGSILGVLPGGGSILGSFASYSVERRISKGAANFGSGAIEGVAGPESANNAGAQTSFIPMLTLGIPSNPVMALMIGALIIQGIVPGPNVLVERPSLFWGIVASMWVGNVMLLILNLPMIGVWVRLMSLPYRMLYPIIVAVCCVGVYSVGHNVADVYMMMIFSAFGYVLIKLDCEPAPLLLGFVIGRLLEEYLRRAMLISRGDPSIFFERPISFTLLVLAALALLIVLIPNVGKGREKAFRE